MIRSVTILLMIISWSACKMEADPVPVPSYTTIEGKTMGTTYTVKYLDSLSRNFKAAIDQLLVEINDEVSTYEPESFISRFNKSTEELPYLNILEKRADAPVHFKKNLDKAKEIYAASDGNFDPTIMPIVNYWGFGYTEKRPVTDVDIKKIDSLITFVGFDKVTQRSAKDGWIYLGKALPGVQLDFSAIAKGYGVDAVALFLEAQGMRNFYVEIGGELRVRGKNPESQWWKIGVNTPRVDAAQTDIQATIALENESMATSGNYRIFYEVEGVKYAHTINPKTGYPEKNTLLSATIFAPDCMTADGYATACMTMGLEKSKALIAGQKELAAYFLYSDDLGTIQSFSTDPTRTINPIPAPSN